jgi:hypothetical protein
VEEDDYGHKWSLSGLFRHLALAGVDTAFLWARIYDVIIKTIISIEHLVIDTSKSLGIGHSNCFELLGFDILVDSALKHAKNVDLAVGRGCSKSTCRPPWLATRL